MNKMDQYKVAFNALPWESPMPGLRFKVYRSDGKQLRLVEYTKDLSPHWCEKGHVGYVLEGILEITFENLIITFHPGDGIFIPAGKDHKHMGKVLSNVVKIFFVEDI
jgi:quercetin dioxygenase-like cupin family protein